MRSFHTCHDRNNDGIPRTQGDPALTLHEPILSVAPHLLSLEVLTRCAQASRVLLALDYDGTLVPIVARPEDAKPSVFVLSLLAELVHLPAVSVAIISGRSLSDLCALLPIPGLMYVGTHGAELRTRSGEIQFLVPPEALLSVMNRLQSEVLPLIGGIPGLALERKQYALALHYRLAAPDDSEQVLQQLQAVIKAYQQQGLPIEVVHGKKVIEVRAAGINKGRALCALLTETPPASLPLYIGDDVTDEDAFREVNNMRGGVSILVADPPHATTAQYYLPNPEAVLSALLQLISLRRHW